MRRVYFDHASTTNIDPDVLRTYEDLLEKYYVNSESLYDEGTEIFRMQEKARAQIAKLLGVGTSDIIFTSGASEANNAALKGCAFAQPEKKHIITTAIEHSSILNACHQLEQTFGYRITYLPVDQNGVIHLEDLKAAIDEHTAVVSIMYVNNETGAINPIEEASEYVKKHSHAYFHTDVTQTIGKLPINFTNIDMASMSAHKIDGLKGSGVFIKRSFVPLIPLINGGEQENGLRGGTSNACVNMVFAKTLRLALDKMHQYHDHIQSLHDALIKGLQSIPDMEINSPEDGLPSIINWSYERIPSEVMQNALNRKGFMVSARSTCDSRGDESYVLKAMGFSDRRASSCIRISLSYENTLAEVDSFITSLKEIIQQYG